MESFAPCLDYILIDESQDFPQSFFELCEMVTNRTVYIAGDIFQDIYDISRNRSMPYDYLLNICYRTDPRTLMFAHAVGMGLYENPVIRWLDDDEWEACGYRLKRSSSKFELSRIPLRRFEDLDTSKVENIKIYAKKLSKIELFIYEIIASIKEENSTVVPGDIAVVFLDSINAAYAMADSIAVELNRRFGWHAIKGYEVKDRDTNSVFISNRNNIKGLEFPFVICVALGEITDNIFYRNTIYMILTRSFITSHLIINSEGNGTFVDTYSKAAKEIIQNGNMVLREPSSEEKAAQNRKIRIALSKNQMSLKDIIESVITEYPELTSRNKSQVRKFMTEIAQNEDIISEEEIIERTRKLVLVVIGE